MKKILFSLIILTTISSCEFLEDSLEQVQTLDIAAGLKEALRVGTDTATSKLAVLDGYLKDEAVKILLPDELEANINKFKAFEINIFGIGQLTGEQVYNSGIPLLGINSLESKEGDLIIGINRAAEAAAKEAGPIFFDAITQMTITDAEAILYGSDTAATAYLVDKTYTALFNTFEPKVNNAIKTVLIGQKPVEELYANFVAEYNKIVNTSVPTGLFSNTSIGTLANVAAISESDISAFATAKGLNGLFLKVQEEEKNIREDPFARVSQ
ncbi:MAG: hypothetical protein ACI9XJ_000495, partial [Marivirga sp.]